MNRSAPCRALNVATTLVESLPQTQWSCSSSVPICCRMRLEQLVFARHCMHKSNTILTTYRESKLCKQISIQGASYSNSQPKPNRRPLHMFILYILHITPAVFQAISWPSIASRSATREQILQATASAVAGCQLAGQ